jgi:flagellar basal body-associated protein FliL
MSLLQIIAVYVVLICAVVAVYFVSQRRRTGPRQGFVEWLKSGFGGQPAVSSTPRPPVESTADSSAAADVVAVLEDLYEEFMGELANLKRQYETRIEQLERDYQSQLSQIRLELAQLREDIAAQLSPWAQLLAAGTARDGSSAVPLGAPGSADGEHSDAVGAGTASQPTAAPGANAGAERSVEKYFEILDELHTGKSPQQIAESLGVSLEDVERVKRIMESPVNVDGA